MNNAVRTALSASALLIVAGGTFASDKHWGYEGESGPENWAGLDAAFATCGTGMHQSPIDLKGFVDSELEPLVISYEAGAKDVVNNGHAIQVNYAPGSTVTIDGIQFELQQFHFHTPSENHIMGRSFPMEMHLVHADAAGNLAVVAVMFEAGADNSTIDEIWKFAPGKAGESASLPGTLSAQSLLPPSMGYYRFSGSLTTPPCSEGVRWIVMKEPVMVSARQAETLAKVLGHPNNRPIQPLNARTVLE